VLSVGACLCGCLFGRFLAGNVEAAAGFRTVPNKITQPVRSDARLAVLWIGHATVLIQMDDKVILTDPVFTHTVGQLSPRLVEPGMEARHLPSLDAVLISHTHFDHLSLGSIEQIESRVQWLGMPPGGLVYLTNFGFPAEEVPSWSSRVLPGDMRVTSVPVRHNGWRYGLDHAWRQGVGRTGWVVEYNGLTVYFAGDSALDEEAFRATAQRFPSIDLAILPIAPIHPRDFMRRIHMDSDEALTAFEWLGAKWMVPIHFDTFVNSRDAKGEPLRLLAESVKQRGIDKDSVVVLGFGEQRILVRR